MINIKRASSAAELMCNLKQMAVNRIKKKYNYLYQRSMADMN